jgi:acyl-CoA thioesterase FadM
MLTAILNSTHLERVKFSPPDEHLHLDSIHSYSNGLSLSGISSALGNLATAHGHKLGIYSGFDPDRNCGWVVLSTKLRILQPVPSGRNVKLETWVASLDSGKLIREYRISDDGIPIIEAAHSFVLFDRIKRRIAIPPKEARERLRGRDPIHVFELDISRRPMPPVPLSEDHVTECVVTSKDIDQNNHLNNSVYLRWAEPHLERYQLSALGNVDFRPFEFGIEFLSEAALDEKVQVRTKLNEQATYFLSSSPNPSVLAVSKANVLKDPKG